MRGARFSLAVLADGRPLPARADHCENRQSPLTVYGKNLTFRGFFSVRQCAESKNLFMIFDKP
jgi:hypothetical protein